MKRVMYALLFGSLLIIAACGTLPQDDNSQADDDSSADDSKADGVGPGETARLYPFFFNDDGNLRMDQVGDPDDGPVVRVKVKEQWYFAKLHVRGGIIKNLEKRSFALTFTKADGQDAAKSERPEILGKRHKSIILNSSANDPTFIKNYVTLSTAKLLGDLREKVTGKPTGFAPRMAWAQLNILFQNESRPSLYILIEDPENDIEGHFPDTSIFKGQNDFLWRENPAGKFEHKTPAHGSLDELPGIFDGHCNRGEYQFYEEDYFMMEYVRNYFLDLDGLTKNFYMFWRPDANAFGVYHWDIEAIVGYAPLGDFYGEGMLMVPPNSPAYGRKWVDQWQDVTCLGAYAKRTDYYNAYSWALNNGMRADAIRARLEQEQVFNIISAAARDDLRSWKTGKDFDFEYTTFLNRLAYRDQQLIGVFGGLKFP